MPKREAIVYIRRPWWNGLLNHNAKREEKPANSSAATQIWRKRSALFHLKVTSLLIINTDHLTQILNLKQWTMCIFRKLLLLNYGNPFKYPQLVVEFRDDTIYRYQQKWIIHALILAGIYGYYNSGYFSFTLFTHSAEIGFVCLSFPLCYL